MATRTKSAFELGKAYAREQVQSRSFHDFVFDELARALDEPDKHWQIETPADALRAAKNTLQQLGWDIDRDYPYDVAHLPMSEQKRWKEGLDSVLDSMPVRKRLASEMLRMVKELTGKPARSPKHAKKNPVAKLVKSIGRGIKKAFR